MHRTLASRSLGPTRRSSIWLSGLRYLFLEDAIDLRALSRLKTNESSACTAPQRVGANQASRRAVYVLCAEPAFRRTGVPAQNQHYSRATTTGCTLSIRVPGTSKPFSSPWHALVCGVQHN